MSQEVRSDLLFGAVSEINQPILGGGATKPTTDKNGNALPAGVLWFDPATGGICISDGAGGWNALSPAATSCEQQSATIDTSVSSTATLTFATLSEVCTVTVTDELGNVVIVCTQLDQTVGNENQVILDSNCDGQFIVNATGVPA